MPHSLLFRLLLPLVVLALWAPASGQAPTKGAGSAGESAEADADVRTARVAVDGEPLFSVRGVSAYPAERRAAAIGDRIRAVAASPAIDSKSLTIEEHPSGSRIIGGSERIMTVLDEDAALEQTTRSVLAQVYRTRIQEAIEAYRRDRRAELLWMHALYALVATIIVLLAVVAARRIAARLREHIEHRYRTHIEGLQDRALQLVRAEQVWRVLTGVLNLVWALAIAAMAYAYLNYVLTLFPWTRGLGKSLLAITIDPLRTLGLGLVGTIPNLIFLVILVYITRGALRLIRVLFEGVATGAVKFNSFDAEWAWPTYRLLRLLVVALALVVAYPYIPGSNSEAFKGVSLFMGIIFSLGSSSLIGNFIAGYSMTYRRAFKTGDRIKVGEHIGDVEQMRLLVTHLRTPKNEEVVVPNSTILSSEVVNYSSMARERGLILHTTVGIGYETPWRQVEAMLLEAAARTGGLRRAPPPFVLQTELGDFCVTYEINAYCDTPQAMPRLYTELHRNILDVFNEYGVQIMTPAYEADPEQPKVTPREQWYAAPARAPEPSAPALSVDSRTTDTRDAAKSAGVRLSS